MNPNPLRLLAAFAFAGLALHAHAASSTRPARTPLWAVLDADGDGTLSPAEIAAAPTLLAALDLDEDGTISAEERQAHDAQGHPLAARSGTVGFNLLLALDANHDGVLQPIEIANATTSLASLDRNGDGLIASAEVRPMLVARNR
jgi:hypothetical protein